VNSRIFAFLRPARYPRAGRRSIVSSAVTVAEEPAEAVPAPATHVSDSDRVAAAHSRAEQRLQSQRGTLRPLGLAVIALVAASTASGHPAPGLHGGGLAATLALAAFVTALAIVIRERFPERRHGEQAAVIAALGAAAVALGAVQPRGATELAAGVAAFMAVARLPLAPGIALAAALTVALDIATALAGSSSSAVLAGTLLCVLLGLMAYFMKQGRESQDRTEVLLAQLEDAQEEQARAAAVAERGRIASELHDVLAHSLSGAAIQLQGARKLADREQAEPQMREAIDRASELVKDGLANARQAVGALRGDELPSVAQLESLIESFRTDMSVDVTLSIEGSARPLPADASLALYRGAQEALTNVARYAPRAPTSVVLRYTEDQTTLRVENRTPDSTAGLGGLAGVGGGRGLAGIRERMERFGGSMQAGPTDEGWRVELLVPA
jgi:signal transduction histidine kinase